MIMLKSIVKGPFSEQDQPLTLYDLFNYTGYGFTGAHALAFSYLTFGVYLVRYMHTYRGP
jgi:DNA polymerase III alpha subunit